MAASCFPCCCYYQLYCVVWVIRLPSQGFPRYLFIEQLLWPRIVICIFLTVDSFGEFILQYFEDVNSVARQWLANLQAKLKGGQGIINHQDFNKGSLTSIIVASLKKGRRVLTQLIQVICYQGGQFVKNIETVASFGSINIIHILHIHREKEYSKFYIQVQATKVTTKMYSLLQRPHFDCPIIDPVSESIQKFSPGVQ